MIASSAGDRIDAEGSFRLRSDDWVCFVLSSGPRRLCGRSALTYPGTTPVFRSCAQLERQRRIQASPFQQACSCPPALFSPGYSTHSLTWTRPYSIPFSSETYSILPCHEFFQLLPPHLRPSSPLGLLEGAHELPRQLRQSFSGSHASCPPGIGPAQLEPHSPATRSPAHHFTKSRWNSVL